METFSNPFYYFVFLWMLGLTSGAVFYFTVAFCSLKLVDYFKPFGD